MIYRDMKGRTYKLIEIRPHNTLMQCEATGDYVIVRNHGWDALGFIRP